MPTRAQRQKPVFLQRSSLGTSRLSCALKLRCLEPHCRARLPDGARTDPKVPRSRRGTDTTSALHRRGREMGRVCDFRRSNGGNRAGDGLGHRHPPARNKGCAPCQGGGATPGAATLFFASHRASAHAENPTPPRFYAGAENGHFSEHYSIFGHE